MNDSLFLALWIVAGSLSLIFTAIFYSVCNALRQDAELINEARRYSGVARVLVNGGLVLCVFLDFYVAVRLLPYLTGG